MLFWQIWLHCPNDVKFVRFPSIWIMDIGMHFRCQLGMVHEMFDLQGNCGGYTVNRESTVRLLQLTRRWSWWCLSFMMWLCPSASLTVDMNMDYPVQDSTVQDDIDWYMAIILVAGVQYQLLSVVTKCVIKIFKSIFSNCLKCLRKAPRLHTKWPLSAG